MATDEKSAAIRFGEIASEIKANAEWRRLLAGEYADEIKALDEIAKRYGGESWNTGGGIHVAVIPLGPQDAMGVTGEVICHYHNSKATSIEDVFYEAENDTSEGMISLVDDEPEDQIEDDAVCSPCPNCCEADPDKLVWLDDEETVRCASCGHEYKP